MRLYKTVGRAITNTMWDSIINEIKQEWYILVKSKGEDVSEVPKITNALLITKWMEYFPGFLHWTFGETKILLYYVICKSDTVPGVAPLMVIGKSYYEDHGSMEKELIMRVSLTHPNFK